LVVRTFMAYSINLYTMDSKDGTMTRRKLDTEGGCPIETTLDVIGGKWKGMVLHRLLTGTTRFNELRRAVPKVTQRMLTRQLRELERDGVIRRQVYAEVPPKVEYSLTEFGLSLRPILMAMNAWGERYHGRARKARGRDAQLVSQRPSTKGRSD
jgi:DNA-binding HxlR family transcriptional regulator